MVIETIRWSYNVTLGRHGNSDYKWSSLTGSLKYVSRTESHLGNIDWHANLGWHGNLDLNDNQGRHGNWDYKKVF